MADIEAFLGLPHGQVKLFLRGLQFLVSFRVCEDVDASIHLDHTSFGDFLHNEKHSGNHHLDFKEWAHPAFCDTFFLGRNVLGLSLDAGNESTSHHPKGLSVTVACSS